MRTTLRRVAMMATCTGLSLGLAAGLAPAQADPTPSGSAAGTWLGTQLTGGLIHNDQYDFDDIALTVDAGFAEVSTGNAAVTTQIRDAVAAHIDDYITGDSFGDPNSLYANQVAKGMVFAQQSGGNPRSYGGADLVTDLESLVSTDPATAGRLHSNTTFTDNTNTIGQAYAAQGLTAAGSPAAAAVTTYLLKQQCPSGYFRLAYPSASAPDQSCSADATTAPGPDVTAIAVTALQSQLANPAVAAAVSRAGAWLQSRAGADGSFGDDDGVVNTNSTGLAGAALGATCNVAAADRAATFVRSLQVPTGETGQLASDVGAVAYNAAGLSAGRANGITTDTQDQWRRATTQAALTLGWDPAAASTVTLSGPTTFQKAGKPVALTVSGASAGERVCLTPGGGQAVVLTGTGGAFGQIVTLPSTTGSTTYSATTGPGAATITVKYLAAKKLRAKLKHRVARGGKERVKVHGLAAGEKVRILLGGHRVAKGVANARGKVVLRFKVKASVGTAKLRILGEFKDRKTVKKIQVLR